MKLEKNLSRGVRSAKKRCPQVGDVIGFTGFGWTSSIITLGSLGVPFWSLSHVGIVAGYKDECLLFESTTLDDAPCAIQKRTVHGVQAQHLDSRIKAYRGLVWHYPLSRQLYWHEKSRLSTFLIAQLGKDYDAIGAFRSGGNGFSWLESFFHEENLSSLFCSELVAAALRDIGVFTTSNASKWNPAKLVRTLRWCGILRKPTRLK